MPNYDKEDVEARRKLAERLFLSGEGLTAIAAHEEIQRTPALMHRWKVQGKWEDKRASKLAKATGTKLAVKPSTLARLEKILEIADIDLDSADPLSDAEAETLVTVTVKMLFKQLLVDIEEDNIRYKSPNQVHDLLFGFMKEMKLAKGQPTEIREERKVLPEDDVEALREGLRRLKDLADRRRIDVSLQG